MYHVPKFWLSLGEISDLDKALSARYKTIQFKYSKTRKTSEFANICQHCGALQGNYFVAFNPQEIVEKFNYDDAHEQFIIDYIKPSEINWDEQMFTNEIVKTLLYSRDAMWWLYNL